MKGGGEMEGLDWGVEDKMKGSDEGNKRRADGSLD